MEEKKNNKGLISLIIILIVLVFGLIGYVVYDKFLKVEYGTNEEIISKNFLSDIKLVKEGKGTDAQKYLLCSDIYDCKNIGEFYIDNIEFYENGEDNKPVYKIRLSWSCVGDGECFYNEQYGFNDEMKLNEVETFYKVDENNKIIECLGNSYNIVGNEYDIELKDLEFPTENNKKVLFYGNLHEFINKENIVSGNIKETEDFGTVYDNVKLNVNDINFHLNCSLSDDFNLCVEETLIINDNISMTFDLERGSDEQPFLLITDEYVIVQKSYSSIMFGDIEIYNYNGKLLKTIKNTTDYLVLFDDKCEILYESDMTYHMKLVDNELHFIDANEGAIYKTLNLDTLEENIIGTIHASTSQQC